MTDKGRNGEYGEASKFSNRAMKGYEGPRCGARKKNPDEETGEYGLCRRQAGWGTDHPGYGHCKWHGGSTPNGRLHAAKEEAMDVVKTVMGVAMDIDPHEALLQCVRITAGEVAYSSMKVEQLSEEEAIGHPESERVHEELDREGDVHTLVETSRAAVELNIWIRVRQDSVASLAKYSKMALDAGIAERAVRIAEQHGDALAKVLSGVFEDLQLTDEQRAAAPQILRHHLMQLEAAPQIDSPLKR